MSVGMLLLSALIRMQMLTRRPMQQWYKHMAVRSQTLDSGCSVIFAIRIQDDEGNTIEEDLKYTAG